MGKLYQPFSVALITIIPIMDFDSNLKGWAAFPQIFRKKTFVDTPKPPTTQSILRREIFSNYLQLIISKGD